MHQLFSRIVPLAVATAISPAVLALTLVLLGGRNNPRLRAGAYLLGGAAAALANTILGLLLAGQATSVAGSHGDPVLDIILGVLMIGVGIAGVVMKPAQRGGLLARLDSRPRQRQLAACLAAGLLSIAANPSTIVPLVAAVRLVGKAATGLAAKALALGMVWAFVLLPMLLPLVLYLISPKAAARILTPISAAATKYARFLGAAICVVIGGVLLYDGIKKL